MNFSLCCMCIIYCKWCLKDKCVQQMLGTVTRDKVRTLDAVVTAIWTNIQFAFLAGRKSVQ